MYPILLEILKSKPDSEVSVYVDTVWFIGRIVSLNWDFVLLHTQKGKDGVLYSMCIRIKDIRAVEFNGDFRPGMDGKLQSEVESQT